MFCFLLNAALIVVQEFAETLEMYDFTRPQEFDHLVDVRVVRKAKYIVISRASLLLRRHVLDDIGDRIGLHREISRAEWYSRRIDRVNSVCMPCVVIAVPILIEALCPFSVGQLSYYAADYLKMPQLVSAYMVSIDLSTLLLFRRKISYDFINYAPVSFGNSVAVVAPADNLFCHKP